jgi:hypothetical protein
VAEAFTGARQADIDRRIAPRAHAFHKALAADVM